MRNFGGGALTEELMAKGAEVVGPFPDDLGLHVDMSAAVLKVSAAPSDAGAFLRYVTRPDAAAVWKAGGSGEALASERVRLNWTQAARRLC